MWISRCSDARKNFKFMWILGILLVFLIGLISPIAGVVIVVCYWIWAISHDRDNKHKILSNRHLEIFKSILGWKK